MKVLYSYSLDPSETQTESLTKLVGSLDGKVHYALLYQRKTVFNLLVHIKSGFAKVVNLSLKCHQSFRSSNKITSEKVQTLMSHNVNSNNPLICSLGAAPLTRGDIVRNRWAKYDELASHGALNQIPPKIYVFAKQRFDALAGVPVPVPDHESLLDNSQ